MPPVYAYPWQSGDKGRVRVKRQVGPLTIVGSVVAAGVFGTGPVVARASDGDIDATAFIGNTCGLSPAMRLTGGTGIFCFSSTDNSPVPSGCAGVSTDTTPPEVFSPNCSITTSGSYADIVCATGSLAGISSITEPDGANEISVPFNALIVSGVGVVSGDTIGVIQIFSISPAAPPDCLTGFTISGAVAIPD